MTILVWLPGGYPDDGRSIPAPRIRPLTPRCRVTLGAGDEDSGGDGGLRRRRRSGSQTAPTLVMLRASFPRLGPRLARSARWRVGRSATPPRAASDREVRRVARRVGGAHGPGRPRGRRGLLGRGLALDRRPARAAGTTVAGDQGREKWLRRAGAGRVLNPQGTAASEIPLPSPGRSRERLAAALVECARCRQVVVRRSPVQRHCLDCRASLKGSRSRAAVTRARGSEHPSRPAT